MIVLPGGGYTTAGARRLELATDTVTQYVWEDIQNESITQQ